MANRPSLARGIWTSGRDKVINQINLAGKGPLMVELKLLRTSI